MKKILTCTVLTLGIVFFSNSNLYAQQEFKGGAGLAFGSEVETIGITVGGVYGLTEDINGAADFIIFFPDNYDWWEFNVNVHYPFHAEDETLVYALGGLNIVTVDYGDFEGSSNTELGLNIGLGTEHALDFGNLFGEVRYVFGDLDQLVLSAGLRFPF